MKFDARTFLEGLYAEPPGMGRGTIAPFDRLTETPHGYLCPADLPDAWREYFEERSAIREYDGNQPREHAEAEAWRETVEAMRRRSVLDR